MYIFIKNIVVIREKKKNTDQSPILSFVGC